MASGIEWPRRGMNFGLVLITRYDPIGESLLIEGEEDVAVKTWLGDMGAKDALWASLRDTRAITCNGTRPKKSYVVYEYITPTWPVSYSDLAAACAGQMARAKDKATRPPLEL